MGAIVTLFFFLKAVIYTKWPKAGSQRLEAQLACNWHNHPGMDVLESVLAQGDFALSLRCMSLILAYIVRPQRGGPQTITNVTSLSCTSNALPHPQSRAARRGAFQELLAFMCWSSQGSKEATEQL